MTRLKIKPIIILLLVVCLIGIFISKESEVKEYSTDLSIGTTKAVDEIIKDKEFRTLSINEYKSSDQSVCQVGTYWTKSGRRAILMPIGKGRAVIEIRGISNKVEKIYRITTYIKFTSKVKVGVDLSKYQGNIDVSQFKENGISFGIVRAGHGYEVEKYFTNYVNQLRFHNLDLGVYYFLESKDAKSLMSIEDAHKQATLLVDMLKKNEIKPKDLTMPIYLDLEDPTLFVGLNWKEKLTHVEALCRTFIEVVNKAGYKNIGIYANKNYYENYLTSAYFSTFTNRWYARYGYIGRQPTINKPQVYTPQLWQVGDSFHLNGITENTVDLNYYYV